MNVHRIAFSSARFLLTAGVVAMVGCSVPAAEEATGTTADALVAQEGLALATGVYESANPDAAYAALSDAERAKVDGVVTPGDLTEEETFSDENGTALSAEAAAATFSGCWSRHQKYARKALLGNTLYTYWQTTGVCVRSGKVTSVSVTGADGETSTPGWRIVHAPTTATKNVKWEGRGKAQFYFVLGAGPWDVQHPTDCIQQRLNANGTSYAQSKSCDLG